MIHEAIKVIFSFNIESNHRLVLTVVKTKLWSYND